MNAWQRFRRRRWVRRYAMAIYRHSGVGWDEAQATASETLAREPCLLRWVHPTDAALITLGIMEVDLL